VEKPTKEIFLPGLRAQMGDWIYYIAVMKLKDIAERVGYAKDIHKGKKLNELIQRELEPGGAKIANYLIRQPQRLFNSIIVGVYGGEPQWFELSVRGDKHHLSTLKLPELSVAESGVMGYLRLLGGEELFALDGQRRVSGIKEALKRASKNSSLFSEEVSVIFVGHKRSSSGLQRTRRLFTTLNRYAKPVSAFSKIALDEDDIAAILVRELIEDYPLFSEERIAFSKGKSLPVGDKKNFTSLVTLYEVIDIVLPILMHISTERDGEQSWDDYKRIRPEPKGIALARKRIFGFWNSFLKHFPDLRDYMRVDTKQRNPAFRFRNDRNGGHILFRPVGLILYARAIAVTMKSGWTLSKSLRRLSKVGPKLNKMPWKGVLWEAAAGRMITRKENRQLSLKLLLYMIGHDLQKPRTSKVDLVAEYASVLNKKVSEVALPPKV
jgi:DNA sulfur modification protein DndB